MSLRSRGALSATAAQTHSGPAAAGRDSASATTLVVPGKYFSWLVYSDKSQVTLLAARGQRRDSVKGENQWFVVHPQFEWAALESRAEVFNTCHGCEEFSVES